jgi:general transcription factor 3C polypeptide 5 (transcription factor C subunit 1)
MSHRSKAPSQTVPHLEVIHVEHPCIVQEVTQGLKSLGGDVGLSSLLSNVPARDKKVNISLRPDDPFAQTTSARLARSRDILVSVKIPKRTGRKRKRGSNGPFESESGSKRQSRGGLDIFKVIHDGGDKVVWNIVGRFKESWRSRALIGFQYSTASNDMFRLINKTLLSSNLVDIKQFSLSRVQPTQEIIPPPEMRLSDTSLGYAQVEPHSFQC